MANARNVSFETLYDSKFTLSTQLIIPNYLVLVFFVCLVSFPFFCGNRESVAVSVNETLSIESENPFPLCRDYRKTEGKLINMYERLSRVNC